jgi:acetyl-CoA synthetase
VPIAVPARFSLAELCCDRHDPQSVAVIEDGGERVLFGELAERSRRIAGGLVARGVGVGDRVAVTLPQGAWCLATHLAILRVGAISVPIAAVFGDEARRFRLDDSGAALSVDSLAVAAALADGAEPFPGAVAMGADDPAIIFYTSGTTGTPKGAVLPQRVVHGHLPGFVAVFNEAPQPGDVFWTPSDWSWIGALGEVVLPTAFLGSPIVATPGRFSVATAYRVLAEHHVTCPFLAPVVMRRMRAEPPAGTAGIQLRAVMTGGEALAPEVRMFMEETFGCALNDIFGQTEANHLASGCTARFATPPGAIGRALPGRRIAILDDAGEVVPPGVSGEIALAADDPVVMVGYWNRPDLTARKIVDGWVRLGDRGSLDDDGFLRFEGRLDDLIKVSGIQVGAEEVEAALLAHPSVAEAGVCGVEHADGGGETVAAFVRLREGAALDVPGLQAVVREAIGPHAAPRIVREVDGFPLTSSGKIQRRELRRLLLAEDRPRLP